MAAKLVYTPVGEIASIVAGARACFTSGRTKPLDWRLRQLKQLRNLVLDNQEAIKQAIKVDLHRPDYEAIVAEVLATIGEVDDALRHLKTWAADEPVPTPPALLPGASFIHREPLGVACIIAPWNFPIQLCLNPLVAALSAGNTAVLKPSEVSPACSALLGELVPRYLDQDAVRVVQGGVAETTALLEQRFDIICYTGNAAVARVVMAAAAKFLTPVLLELGGKSPAIVDASANLDLAAKRIIANKCLNAGQVCIAPDYVLVEKSVEGALTKKLSETMSEFFGPDPQQSDSFGRIINRRHFDRIAGLLKDCGGTVVAGGKTDASDLYIAPTLISSPRMDSELMKQEIFGPLLPIVPVQDMAEAVSIVNKGEKPLALYIFSSSSRARKFVIDNTSSGGVVENDAVVHNINPHLGFGGVGESGLGAYHGKHGFVTFSHSRSVFQQDTLLDIIGLMRYPPYTPGKLQLARTLIMALNGLPIPSIGFKDVLIAGLTVAVGVLAAKLNGNL